MNEYKQGKNDFAYTQKNGATQQTVLATWTSVLLGVLPEKRWHHTRLDWQAAFGFRKAELDHGTNKVSVSTLVLRM